MLAYIGNFEIDNLLRLEERRGDMELVGWGLSVRNNFFYRLCWGRGVAADVCDEG
jgi:hypothetical protein